MNGLGNPRQGWLGVELDQIEANWQSSFPTDLGTGVGRTGLTTGMGVNTFMNGSRLPWKRSELSPTWSECEQV